MILSPAFLAIQHMVGIMHQPGSGRGELTLTASACIALGFLRIQVARVAARAAGFDICDQGRPRAAWLLRYQLETDSLGGNPVLRRLKDNEEIRPLSANRNTIKAMERADSSAPAKFAPSLSCGV